MSPKQSIKYLSDYQAPWFKIDAVEMAIALDHSETIIETCLKIKALDHKCTEKTSRKLHLDGNPHLSLLSIHCDGKALSKDDYDHQDEALIIYQCPGQAFELSIKTSVNPEANKALMGLYVSNDIFCTQCEAEGFRRLTFFPDRPDVMSIYTVRLEANRQSCPILLSNGNLLESGACRDPERHYALWHDPHPKPSYLFAVIAGDLDHIHDEFITTSKRKVALGIYVEKGKADQAGFAMQALKRSMAWDESRYGREYDLDCFNIVAVSDFNMGAMENKGLNIFNDKYILANPKTATDLDYEHIDSIIAHEYFHNWTGNRITCRDWFQLCLKEGLTVFRDQEYSADIFGKDVKRIKSVRRLWAQQYPEDAGPLSHPVRPDHYQEINNFYTATIYEKGAEIIRMLQSFLGQTVFEKGLTDYFKRYDGQAVTIEALINSLEHQSGQKLQHFMRWYVQPGTPNVLIDHDFNEETQTLKLSIAQSPPKIAQSNDNHKALPIPIRFGLLKQNGEPIKLDPKAINAQGGDYQDGLFCLNDETATLTIHNIVERPVLSLLRGFSAPILLTHHLSKTDRKILACYDDDLFNRWFYTYDSLCKALKTLSIKTVPDEKPTIPKDVIDIIKHHLTSSELPEQIRALMVSIPDENEVARLISKDIYPDHIHQACQKMRHMIGCQFYDELMQLYHDMEIDEAFEPSPEQMGKRNLRIKALQLACYSKNQQAEKTALKLFQNSQNMSETFGALTILTHQNSAYKDEALDQFYDQFQDNPLVLDKWFAVQATAPHDQTLDRIHFLAKDSHICENNPNRVRALYGAFSTQNLVQFHRADGKGYKLITDLILRIDKKNPQLAARLLTCFRSWKAIEETRQDMIETNLKKIANAKNISNDLEDIIKRIYQ